MRMWDKFDVNIKRSQGQNHWDEVSWKLTSNGDFTTKSAYQGLRGEGASHTKKFVFFERCTQR